MWGQVVFEGCSTLNGRGWGDLDQHPDTGSLGTNHSNGPIISFFPYKLRTMPPVYLPTTSEDAGGSKGTRSISRGGDREEG